MAHEQWHPEIEITENLVKVCIEEQFPTLAPIKTLRLIGEGWDNKVFLINGHLVFRFPHRAVSVKLLEQENKVLNHLHSIISLEIPAIQYIGQANDHYPFPFHGYPLVAGEPGYRAGLTLAQRIASLTPLAKFLKELHHIKEKQALAFGAEYQTFDRTNIDSAAKTLTERVQKIIDRKICSINQKCFEHELTVAKNLKLPRDDQVLVHGDLYSRHLIFRHNQLTGIIDWGDNGINNRTVDLAVIFSFYPNSCHKLFFDIYGQVEDNTWQYARFLGLYTSLTIILYGHAVSNPLLVSEAFNAIQWINPELINNE